MDARTVLIVDDDPTFRQLLRLNLERSGFIVIGEAPNGAQGVSDAFRLRPDIVTLDHHMPHLEGRLAYEHIREIRPETLVVVVSGTLEEPPEWADEFVAKDRVRELGEIIKKLLEDGRRDP